MMELGDKGYKNQVIFIAAVVIANNEENLLQPFIRQGSKVGCDG